MIQAKILQLVLLETEIGIKGMWLRFKEDVVSKVLSSLVGVTSHHRTQVSYWNYS